MKKIILLTTGILLFSCSTEDVSDDQNLINEIESLNINEETISDKSSSTTNKDTDNDGINDEADADVDGTIDNGTDSDGDGINDLADVDTDNDGIEDNDDNENDENEYSSLSSSNLSQSVQQKISDYISTNYPNDTVTEVEIENQKIEVELSSGIELIFDINGNFVRLDD